MPRIPLSNDRVKVPLSQIIESVLIIPFGICDESANKKEALSQLVVLQ